MRFLNFLSLVIFLKFAACSYQDQKPQSDAEGFFGRTQNFVHVTSPTQASIISVLFEQQHARKILYEAAKGLTEQGEIPFNQITFSQDKKFLTLLGNTQIYGFVDLPVEEINQTRLPSLQIPVESLCIASPQNTSMGSTGYQEVQFRLQDGTLTAVGIKDGVVETFGTATREDQPFEVIYRVQNFGMFRINLGQTLAPQSLFYKTTVNKAEWTTANNIYCHQSRTATHQVFVSSSLHLGNLSSGPSGADSRCMLRAISAGIQGNWKAIISGAGQHAKDRLQILGPITVVGTTNVIATNATTLWDGSIDFPINRNEFGVLITDSNKVWTGSALPNGTLGPNDCVGWTQDNFASKGSYGSPFSTQGDWLAAPPFGSQESCDNVHHLYCITQP